MTLLDSFSRWHGRGGHEKSQMETRVANGTHRCMTMSSKFVLSREKAATYVNGDTLIATFTNPQAAHFAVNWARGLQSVGLKSVIGISERLGSMAEGQLQAAGGGLFCADGRAMKKNGQAGRWAEVAPLLIHGFNLLLSDSDIGWLQNPLP